MEQEEFQPVPRDDVLRDIRFALSKGFRFRPRKRDHYQEDDFSGWAKAVLEQLELSGTRFFRPARREFDSASHLTRELGKITPDTKREAQDCGGGAEG